MVTTTCFARGMGCGVRWPEYKEDTWNHGPMILKWRNQFRIASRGT